MRIRPLIAAVSAAMILSMPMTVFAASSPSVTPTPPSPPTPPSNPPQTPAAEVVVPVPEAAAVSPKTYDFGYLSMSLMMGAGGVTAVLAAKKAKRG